MEIDKEINILIRRNREKNDWVGVAKKLAHFIRKKNVHPLYVIYYAIALYYQKKYKEALHYSEKAFKSAPDDPFILYHHGIILMHNKAFDLALSMWYKIISLPASNIIEGYYGGGKRWANSLLNDVLYYIAITLFYKNDLKNSVVFYKIHLNRRRRGISSFMTKRDVLKELNGTSFLMEYEKKYPEKARPIIGMSENIPSKKAMTHCDSGGLSGCTMQPKRKL